MRSPCIISSGLGFTRRAREAARVRPHLSSLRSLGVNFQPADISTISIAVAAVIETRGLCFPAPPQTATSSDACHTKARTATGSVFSTQCTNIMMRLRVFRHTCGHGCASSCMHWPPGGCCRCHSHPAETQCRGLQPRTGSWRRPRRSVRRLPLFPAAYTWALNVNTICGCTT